MINWDLTNKINNNNNNGYRQSVNRGYFQRYLNGESVNGLLSEMQSSPYDETVNGKRKRGVAFDFKITSTSLNSNDVGGLINAQNGLGVSLEENPLRNKSYDYIESFVVYNGSTNIVYKVGVATGFLDVVDNDI